MAGALIEKSGLDTAMEAMAEAFVASGEDPRADLDPSFRRAWKSAAASLDLAELLRRATQARLAASLTEAEMAKLMAFYDGPLGRRLVAIERASTTKEAQARVEAEGPRLRAEAWADPERRAIYKRLIEVSGALDMAFDAAAIVMRAMMEGAQAASEGTPRLSGDELDGFVLAQTETMLPEIKSHVERAVAATYGALSIEELQAYNEFMATPAGAKLIDAFLQSLSDALWKFAYDFGERLARRLKEEEI